VPPNAWEIAGQVEADVQYPRDAPGEDSFVIRAAALDRAPSMSRKRPLRESARKPAVILIHEAIHALSGSASPRD